MSTKKIRFLGNEELETKVKAAITDFVLKVRGARSEKEKQWEQYYRLWKSKDSKDDTNYAGRANTFAPFGHRAIEVYAARVPQLVFERDEVVKILPGKDKSPEAYIKARLNTERVIKKFEHTKQRAKWTQFFRDQAIYGTAVAGLGWRFDTRDVRYSERKLTPQYDADGNLMAEPQVEYVESIKELTTFDAPDLRNLDLKKFFIDPTARSLDDAPFVVEETDPVTYQQLIRMAKDGAFDIARVRALKGRSADRIVGTIINDSRFQTTGFSDTDFKADKDTYILYEYWGQFDIDDETEANIVATLAGDTLLRFEVNPYWHQKKPYIMSPYIQDSQSCYGLAMLEPVAKEILCANTIKNQTIDRTTQNLQAMWLCHRGANIKAESLRFAPNKVIQTNIMDGLAPLRPNEMSLQQAMQMLEYLDRSVQETTGATNMLAGTETNMAGRTTAFALKSNLNESTVKLKSIVDTAIEYAVLPYWYMVQDLYCQFATETDTVEVLGEEGRALTFAVRPEDVLSDFDVEVLSADALINDNYQVQNIMSYLNWIQQNIPMMMQISQVTGQPMQIPDVNELADRVWNKLGFKEPVPKIQMSVPQAPQQGQIPGPQNAPGMQGNPASQPIGGPQP